MQFFTFLSGLTNVHWVLKFLDSSSSWLIETVSAKEKVSLTGFGTFAATERSARTGRNPQTGEELQLAATTIPSFKAGKLFKDAVKS